jgi:hypothetical protein
MNTATSPMLERGSNADILLEKLPNQLILYFKNSHHATNQNQHSLFGVSVSFSSELYTASNNGLLSISKRF